MKTWNRVFGMGIAVVLVIAATGCGPSKSNLPVPGSYKTAGPIGPSAILPSDATVLDGSYPLARPLFIYVNKEALKRPEVATFVKFYLDNAKKLAGHEVEAEQIGFFTRIGRALGLSATPA